MRRLLAAAALVAAIGMTAIVQGQAVAVPIPLSYLNDAVLASDPNIADNYFEAECRFYHRGTPLPAAFYTMTASVTGTYGFKADGVPTGIVYFGVFDPTYSAANCRGTDRESGGKVNLIAGHQYTFVVWTCHGSCVILPDVTGQFELAAKGPGLLTWTSTRPTEATSVPSWVQSYGRAAQTDSCLQGWNPSWEEWPNGRKGGWVCTRSIPSLGSQTD